MKIRTFIQGIFEEIRKVEWPTKKELINYSLMVIIFIITSSLAMALLDILFNKARTFLINNV